MLENIVKEEEKQNNLKQDVFNFLKDLIIIVSIVLSVRTFLILPFQISGQSMYDSYYDKEFIIVDRFSYLTFKDPKRGDVVVFNTHISGKEYFIKRVIGLPGETLKIQSGSVFVKKVGSDNFVELNEKYLNESNDKSTFVRGDDGENTYNIPEGNYFVMGDNRVASTDSRSCFSSCEGFNKSNFIKKKDITGKILIDFGHFYLINFLLKGGELFKHPDLGIDTKPKWFSSPSNYKYD